MDTQVSEDALQQNAAAQPSQAEPVQPKATDTATPDAQPAEPQAPVAEPETEAILCPQAVAAVEQSDSFADEHNVAVAETHAEQPLTVEQILAHAREVSQRDAAEIQREEVSRMRQNFASARKAQVDALLKEHVDNGGNAEEFQAPESAEESEFNAIITAIKEKKAAHLAQLEAEKAANLERKNAIIAEILEMAKDTDNVNRTFPHYKELQEEFNATGEVPATDETDVWKRYQEARETFSDSLKINKELRDYDFQKNLEQKELIIAEAAKLNEEPDVVTAFKNIQELQGKWREIGPVAKDLRDEVWNRFKDATQDVYRRYQAFFEERKAREAENEAGKIAICERVEALDFSQLKTYNDWEKMTEVLKEAQADWKKFGYASRKMNNALFARFRAICDTFFALKADFFKRVKEESNANLAAKTRLAERAEQLKDSTEWRKTTDELVKLQQEWKQIGAVAKKHSDAIWHRFQSACDEFFANKKAATSGVRQTEQANLQAKRDLITELDKITEETPKDEARSLIQDLQERWKSIGHVPFREKDKVYEAFRTRINEVRDKYDLNDRRGRMERFENSVAEMKGDENKMSRERERQMRLLETRRAELRTYENNLGFLNAKSKSGNSLIQDFERKIERLKGEIAQLEEKVRLIDSQL